MSSSIESETIEKPSLPLQATLQIARAITIERQYLFFFFKSMLHGMQHLSSLTRHPVWIMAVNVLSPNHWTTSEFPETVFIYFF